MILGLSAMTLRTCSAIARTFIGSGPTTRNCTGKPTGGPKTKRSTRARASGSAPSASARSSRALTRSRASRSFGHDDDLGEVRVRQHRIEPEPEARRALADIGRVGHDVGIAGEQALGLLGRRVGDADGGAFRQPHLEEQLGAGRGREELLLDEAEAGDRRDEHQHGRGDDGLAPAQAQLDHAAQRCDRCGCRRSRRDPVRRRHIALSA